MTDAICGEAEGEARYALEIAGVTKRFGATVALADASVRIQAGEVHALLGENGAGKSTLLKLLSGLIQPNTGSIAVFGKPARLRSPRDSHRLGIQTAFQELTLVKDLTVTQNMLLPYEPVALSGQIRSRQSERMVEQSLGTLGLNDIDPRTQVSDLDLPQRQKIEIARAVSRKPRVLLLDEPTSALSGTDVDWLFGMVQGLRDEGQTIVFITHRLQEVRAVCDVLTVLRNGKDVGTGRVDEISDDKVVQLVIGRSLEATYPPKPARAPKRDGPPALSARNLASAGQLEDATFDLWPGEMLGVGALQGMGQLELFLALFGMANLSAGHTEIDGRRVALASPQDAVKQHIGISLVPEDRKNEALFLKMSGRANISLPVIKRFARFGWINRRAEDAAVRAVLDALQIHSRAMHTACAAFSGGNQQKIAIAKWLLAESRVLLMYDPTRGVDIGTKHEIYVMMRAFAEAGGAILIYSTEVPELVNLCDRVLVIYRGRVVDEQTGSAISEEAIMRASLGGTSGLLEIGAP